MAANRDHLGLSAAIQVPWQGTWIGTFGEAEAGIDVSADMRFGIASNSKAMEYRCFRKWYLLCSIQESIRSNFP